MKVLRARVYANERESDGISMASLAARMGVTLEAISGPYESPCWFSDRVPSTDGYVPIRCGPWRVEADGRRRRAKAKQHRLALVIVGVLMPDELMSEKGANGQVDHGCLVKRCCRPRHLHIVTARENLARSNAASANGIRTGRCPQGHLLSGANVYQKSGGIQCLECMRRVNRRKAAEDRAIVKVLRVTHTKWRYSTPAFRAAARAEHRAKQSA